MDVVSNIIYIAVYAIMSLAPISVLALILWVLKVPTGRLIFTTLTLFGIISGLAAFSYGHSDGQAMVNAFGVYFGDELHQYVFDNYADTTRISAGYSILWIFRLPQIVLFTSSIFYALAGLVLQVIYNIVKRPAPVKKLATIITTLSLVVLLCISTGAIYASQSEGERSGPTEPWAVPIIQVSLPGEPSQEIPDWDYIDTYRVEFLSVSEPSRGRVFVEFTIINTGTEEGKIEIHIEVDGQALNSTDIALQSGGSEQVRFSVFFPIEGVYTISIGDLYETIEI